MKEFYVEESKLAKGQGISKIDNSIAKEILGNNLHLVKAYKNSRFDRQIFTSASGVSASRSLGFACVPNKALIKLYEYILQCYTGNGRDVVVFRINESPDWSQIGIELLFENSPRCCIVLDSSNRITYKEKATVGDDGKLVNLLSEAFCEAFDLLSEVPVYGINCWFKDYGPTNNVFESMYEGVWSLGFCYSESRNEYAMNYLVG